MDLKVNNETELRVPAPFSREGEKEPGNKRPPRVVVVGAGFGGLNLMQQLGNKEVEVLVLDRNNYHGFWPLLYQVATAGLEPNSIAYPVREITHHYRNLAFERAEVLGIDLDKKQVNTDHGWVPYDYLVLAAGSANNYFGSKTIPRHTYSLKDVDEAVEIRQKLVNTFEEAVLEKDPKRREILLTFVIVGAGPTGVELAGAFAELVFPLMKKYYSRLEGSKVRIVLVEAHTSLLETFPKGLQKKAEKHLRKMGIEIRQNSKVTGVENGVITFEGGSTMQAGMVVWAAGVRASELGQTLGIKLGHSGRVPVEPTLNLKDRPEVFVIGDMAELHGYKKGQEDYPMVAPVAIQMGEQTAHNILAQIQGHPMKPFHYFDKGTMATIGRKDAVVDAFGIRLDGPLAWLTWLVVHLFFLIGFRNRFLVLLSWVYNYITYNRGVRLLGGIRHGSS